MVSPGKLLAMEQRLFCLCQEKYEIRDILIPAGFITKLFNYHSCHVFYNNNIEEISFGYCIIAYHCLLEVS